MSLVTEVSDEIINVLKQVTACCDCGCCCISPCWCSDTYHNKAAMILKLLGFKHPEVIYPGSYHEKSWKKLKEA